MSFRLGKNNQIMMSAVTTRSTPLEFFRFSAISGFVESKVNYVDAKRFTMRQQMQWGSKYAHLLMQTRVLNGELIQMSGGILAFGRRMMKNSIRLLNCFSRICMLSYRNSYGHPCSGYCFFNKSKTLSGVIVPMQEILLWQVGN
jgi:hypothetical protein